ncbi:hypothetical protein AOQ84DRAFT_438807, partial [Glonium stellatum]
MCENGPENLASSPLCSPIMDHILFNDYIERLRNDDPCSPHQLELHGRIEATGPVSAPLHTLSETALSEPILSGYYLDADSLLVSDCPYIPYDSRLSASLISGEAFGSNNIRKETLTLSELHPEDNSYSTTNLPVDFQFRPEIGSSSNANAAYSEVVLTADFHPEPFFDSDGLSMYSTSVLNSWEVIQRPTSMSKFLQGDASTSHEHNAVEEGQGAPHTLTTVKHITPKSKKTRRKFKQHERQKMNLIRQNRACIRCQWLKEDCGEGYPCPRCQGSLATAKIWRMPCFRGRITDAELHRT